MKLAIPKIKKILFTTNFSKHTRHAFNHAVGLAIQYSASLTILVCQGDTPQIKSQDFRDFLVKNRWAEARQFHEQEIRQALEEMLAAAKDGAKGKNPRSDETVVN
jgi:nucleotide-binding universal stress UspA family protein